jgi:hypothetical protein
VSLKKDETGDFFIDKNGMSEPHAVAVFRTGFTM